MPGMLPLRSRPCTGGRSDNLQRTLAAPSRGPTSVRRVRPSRTLPRVAAYLQSSSDQAASVVDVEKDFKRLQNGSDIRGVALQGPAGEAVTLTPSGAYFIAYGFVRLLRDKGLTDLKVAVGNDPRISAPLLRPAVLTGLLNAGAAVVDAELCTTPAMFYSIIAPDSDINGSIMMTASHMPSHNNGLKFFVGSGGLEKTDIAKVLAYAAEECSKNGIVLGRPTSDFAFVLQKALEVKQENCKIPLLDDYSAHLRSVIIDGINHPDPQLHDKPLTGFKIAVDAGNGSGGFFASKVLAPLGADVSGSQFLDPDGTFPNHIPNPENKEAMAAAIGAVKRSGADLGIVFDTDVDRSAIVDASGLPINSNRFIALMSAITLREHPGTTIVTDSVTSNGLTEFIEKLGGSHLRYKRGYKNVISKGEELGAAGVDCQLMMETSGHGALAENHYLDDGAYLAVKALIEMVRLKLEGRGGLAGLLQELAEPLESAEYRIKILDPDFKAVGSKVLDEFHAWITAGAGGHPGWTLNEVNHEGWRVNVDEGNGKSGWLLLRQSLHDPLLVLNVESDVPGGVASTKAHALAWLLTTAQGALDLSTLGA